MKNNQNHEIEKEYNIYTNILGNNNCNNMKKNSVEDKSCNYHSFLKDLDDVQKLKRLYLIFSGNEKKINSQKFVKLVSDAGLLNRDFDSKYADILFYAGSKSKTHIDFNSFCDIILKIAEIKFPLEFIRNETVALSNVLKSYFFPLLYKIYSQSNSNYHYINNNNKNTQNNLISTQSNGQRQIDYVQLLLKLNSNMYIKETLEKHLYIIIKIYQKYFPWESLNISMEKKIVLSEKAFLKFCKDFEIQPNLVSLVKLNNIYTNTFINKKIIFSVLNSILEKNIKNQGNYYTLFHFISCIYLISIQSLLIIESSNNINNYNTAAYLHTNKNAMSNTAACETNSNYNFITNDKIFDVDYKLESFLQGQDISKNLSVYKNYF